MTSPQQHMIVNAALQAIRPRSPFFEAAVKITFYHSSLCPRCYLARKALLAILQGDQDIEIEEIDVLAHPLQTWSDGVRLFPALKISDRILSGIFLDRKKILAFIRGKGDSIL